MTSEPLPAALRRDRIAALVQDRGFIRVAELSRIFRTSPVTIRTDLDDLASRDRVRRVHGGAVPTLGPATPVDPPTKDPLSVERAALGAAAAGLVEAGQTVVLAGSAATRMVARALAQRTELDEVVVITNDLHIALELQSSIPRLTLIVTGGTLRADSPDLGDPLAGLLLADVTADLSIVGCGAITAERGLSETNVSAVEVARRLLRAGDRKVVVADTRQVGGTSPARVARSEEIDLLVTGAAADAEQLARLRERGVDIRIVE
jgi:DeoR family transcriptional regulator, aga operon transcriptional repressor